MNSHLSKVPALLQQMQPTSRTGVLLEQQRLKYERWTQSVKNAGKLGVFDVNTMVNQIYTDAVLAEQLSAATGSVDNVQPVNDFSDVEFNMADMFTSSLQHSGEEFVSLGDLLVGLNTDLLGQDRQKIEATLQKLKVDITVDALLSKQVSPQMVFQRVLLQQAEAGMRFTDVDENGQPVRRKLDSPELWNGTLRRTGSSTAGL